MAKLCGVFILFALAVVARGIRIDPPKIERVGKYFDNSNARITVNDVHCSKGNGIYPHPTDCTQYLACYEGTSQVRSCPEGFKFDSYRHCTPEADADCGTPKGIRIKLYNVELTCPEENGQFPFPGDCRKYITCDNWTPTSWMCNGEQVYEQGVGCWDGGVCHDSEPEHAKAPRVSAESVQCPMMYGYFPFPQDCHEFLVCVDGVPTLHFCPKGNVYRDRIGCVEGDVCPPRPFGSEVVCKKGNGLYPHPTDCTQYLACYEGTSQVKSCPEGFKFDSYRHCTPEADADCGTPRAIRIKLHDDDDEVTCPEQDGQFPYPGDCRKYITCVDWTPTYWQCNFGMFYYQGVGCWYGAGCSGSEPEQATISAESVQCPTSYGYFPFLEDCHKFLVCVDGVPTLHFCPEGHIYLDRIGCVEGDVCPPPMQAGSEDIKRNDLQDLLRA